MTREDKIGLSGFAIVLLFVFVCTSIALSGCAFQVPKILNPVGWFKTDPLKKIDAAEERIFLSKVQLVTIAQGLLAGTILELEAVQRPDAATIRALEYAKRAQENLVQAAGPLPPPAVRAAEQIQKLRASADGADRAKGDKLLAKIDEKSATEIGVIFKTRQLLENLREKEADALRRAQVAEAQRDTVVTWVVLVAAGWLFFAHVLPRLAELHPATAGLAKLATGFAKLFAHTGRKT